MADNIDPYDEWQVLWKLKADRQTLSARQSSRFEELNKVYQNADIKSPVSLKVPLSTLPSSSASEAKLPEKSMLDARTPLPNSSKGQNIPGPFSDIQKSLPEGYRVYEDPNAPNRMFVASPTGKQTVSLNIAPHEEQGAFGRVWKMLPGSGKDDAGKVFSDQITGTFGEDTGDIRYSGATSSQMVGSYLDAARQIAEKKGTDWGTEVHNLTSKGDEDYALSPLRSLPATGGIPGQRKTARSIEFRTANTSGRATPQQTREIEEDFNQRILLATRGQEAGPITMSGGKDTGARQMEFKRLAAGQFAFGKSGYVESTLNRERIPEEPSAMWASNRKPDKVIKAPNNAYALDQATPYTFDTQNKPTAMSASPITDFGPMPDYVQSNIKGMGNFRVGNVMRSLNPVSGGGFEYQASNEPKAAFWGTEATVPIPIKGLKIQDLLSGKASLSMDQKMLSKPLGGGVDVAHIGTLQREGKDPEEIKARFGAREFNYQKTEMYIPNFINRITGEASDINEEMINKMTPEQIAANDIVSTEPFVGPLSEKQGMNVVRRGGKEMGLTLYGAAETDTSTKFALKAGTSPTGEAQSVEIGGQKYEANLWTGAVKGGENLMNQFGAMRPREWMNILGDFAMRNKQGGRQMLQEFRNEYVKSNEEGRYAPAELGQAMNVDLEKLSARWSKLSGKEDLGGVEFLKQVYQDTAMRDRDNPERQARNMQRYGQSEGVGGREMSASVWSKSSLASLKEDFATAMRVKTPKMTDEQVQGQWGKFFREEPGRVEGSTNLYGITENTASFGRQLIPTRTENTFKNTLNWDFMVAATNKFDEFAKQTGMNVGQIMPQGDSARSAMGLWQYASHQASRRDAMSKGTEQAMPTNYTSVSPETWQGVSAYLKGAGTDLTSLEKVKAVQEQFFADVPEDNLLYSPESKTWIANPKSIPFFDELGVESSASAKAYLPGLEAMGEIVSPESGLKPHEMEAAGEEATSGFYSHVSSLIGGKGEFIKRALERKIPGVFGGTGTFDPTLETHETSLMKKGYQRIARQFGLTGKAADREAEKMQESGAQTIFTRYPMLNALKGVFSGALQKRSTKEAMLGKEALRNIENNPRMQNSIGTSEGYSELFLGDKDKDPGQWGAAFKRVGNKIKSFFDPAAKAQQITNESINAELERTIPNEKVRNKLSATVSELGDYADEKDVQGKMLSNIGKHDPEEFLTAGLTARRTGIATGETYFTDTSGPTSYNVTLDALTGGKTTPVAKMLSESYIAKGDEGPYMHLSVLGERAPYNKFNKKTGKANTRNIGVGTNLPLDPRDPNALGKNVGTLLRGSAALAEQFGTGIPLKGIGENEQIYSPEMVAEQFALEGEAPRLAERLKEVGPQGYSKAVVGYHQDVIARSATDEEAQNKIFNTPAWFGLLKNVKMKGRGRTDPMAIDPKTGQQKQMIEGEESGFELFESRLSDTTRERLQGAVAQEAVHRKNRDKNPRNLMANFMGSAARTMTGVLQTGMQTISRMLNIDTRAPDDFERVFQGVKDAMPSEADYFAQKAHEEAVQQGYTGSLQQFKSERQAAKKLSSVPIESETTGGVGTPPPPTPPVSQGMAEPEGPKKPKRVRNAKGRFMGGGAGPQPKPVIDKTPPPISGEPLPISKEADERRINTYDTEGKITSYQKVSEWEQVRGLGTSREEAARARADQREQTEQGTAGEAADPKKFGPAEVRAWGQAEASGFSQRAGRNINDIRIPNIERALQQKPLYPEIHRVLEKIGLRGESTPKSVDVRIRQAMAEKRGEFLGALSPEQLARGAEIPRVQEQVEQTWAQYQNTPGIDKYQVKQLLAQAGQPDSVLAQDVQAIGATLKDYGNVKSKELTRAMKLSKTATMQGIQSRLTQAEMSGVDSNEAIKKMLVKGRISEAEVAGNMGIHLENASPEDRERVKQAAALEPSFKTALKASASLAGVKGVSTFAPVTANVGAEARRFEKEEGSGSLGKSDYISVTKEKIESLDKAHKAYSETLEKLNNIQGDTTKTTKEKTKAEQDFAVASAKYKAEAAGFISDAARKNIDLIQGQISASGGVLGTKLAPELSKSLKAVEAAEKTQMEADEGVKSLAPQSVQERFGSAARHMLGGFGLMYLRSVANFATSGWGYGQQQRQAFEQASAQGAYQATGAVNLPVNQQNMLNTKQALYGTNIDPRSSFQSWAARTPVARDAYNVGAAGIGTWGYTQFAAGQIGLNTPGGAALARAALPLGIAAGVGSMMLDANARAQNPESLAYRTTSGKGGFNDYLALAQMTAGSFGNYVSGGKAFENAPKQMEQYFANKQLQLHMNRQIEQGASTEQILNAPIEAWKEGPQTPEALARLGKADIYAGFQAKVAERYQNYSTQAQATATGFMASSGMNVDDTRLKGIISDYELGGQGAQLTQQMMSGLGFTPAQAYAKNTPSQSEVMAMYAQGNKFGMTPLTNQGALQAYLTNAEMSEGERAQLQFGAQRAGQLPGIEKMKGIGGRGGEFNTEKAIKFLDKLGQLSDSNFGVLQTQMQAYELQKQAGVRTAKAPDIDKLMVRTTDERGRETYKPKDFTPEQTRDMQQAATAQVGAAQNRLNIMQRYQTQTAMVGRADLGGALSNFVGAMQPGREFMADRFLSGDAMTMQLAAQRAPTAFNQLQGPRTIQGTQLSQNFMANADMDVSGRLTGLGTFRSSLQMGTQNPLQTSSQIFGSMSNQYTQAMVRGVVLPSGGITIPGTNIQVGTPSNPLAGQMAAQQLYAQQQRENQQAGFGLQRQGMQQDYAYQMKMWGLQDQQRSLGWSHQLAQFGFQEQGMALSRQGAAMQNQNFYQNMGMQQQQTQVQRGWQQQDWGINAQTRAMQWGWKQDDFQEEKRFMTGRQRRLAERGQEREGVMHNLEDEQIGRQKERTKELWKMEDTRFEVQKQQHAAEYQHTLKQMALQKKEFEEQKKYAIESKKLEDEIIKLQRQHWLEQHKLSQEQLKLSERQTKQQLEYNQTMDVFNLAMEEFAGTQKTLAEDSLIPMYDSLSKLDPTILTQLTDLFGALGYVNTPDGSSDTSSDSGSNSNKKAFGGPVFGGQDLIVGEMGPERFRPNVSGTIVPSYSPPTDFSSLNSTVLSNRSTKHSNKPTTIILNVGNEELKRFVVDVVGDEF